MDGGGGHPNLWDCMVEYAKGRGRVTMEEISWGRDTQFCRMVVDQDIIRWRRFMERMVCKGLWENNLPTLLSMGQMFSQNNGLRGDY